MSHLSISMLGGLRISVDGKIVSSFESDKVRALLSYLVVETRQPHRRETLAGLLWPDCSEQTARHNLSQALLNLRKVLDDRTANPAYLLITGSTIQFNRQSSSSVDLERFLACSAALEKRQGLGTDIVLLEEMVELYRGEFLRGFSLKGSPEFDEWVLVQRTSHHQQVMSALSTLAGEYEKQGNFPSARRCCERQLALDPWMEEAHGQLMRLLALDGHRSAALAQYEACKKILADELGAEPSQKIFDLYEQIRLDTFQPRAETTPFTELLAVPKLPLPLTPFLGRERELAELSQMLADPQCRCISLVGPGGMGKTRLALETAGRNKNEFTHGVAFIPLVSVETAEASILATAAGIGFTFYGPGDPKEQLLAYLGNKHLLLILDNVEHLLAEENNLAAITSLIIEILQQAPQVKLLVTSREALNIEEEWVYELQGLDYAVPEPGDSAIISSAIALFIQHARRVRPGFAMDAGNQSSIAGLCRLVEGMPLAIELAATWVRLLSPDEILVEVTRSLDFLNTRIRDLPERHRSIRAVFEPSWRMLSLEEEQVLNRLSVFHGGFSRQAAEQVAGASLLVLSSLVIRSLVRRTKAGRYEIHELIRQYASSRLAENPVKLDQAQERHCLYYLRLLESKDLLLHSPDQKAALNELIGEAHNIREAWDWALNHQKVQPLYQASAALRQLFEMRSWFKEGERTFGRAAEAIRVDRPAGVDAVDPSTARLAMQAHCGFFMFRQGKSAAAYAALVPCAEQLRASADPIPLVYCLIYLGIVGWELGRFSEAEESLHEGLGLAQKFELHWFEAHFCEFLGIVAKEQGEHAKAREKLIRSLAIFRKIGDRNFTAHCLSYLGRTLHAQGDFAEAEQYLRESLVIAREMDYQFGSGLALDALGKVAYAQGKFLEAQKYFSESASLFADMGDAHRLSRTLNGQGMVALALDQVAEAQHAFKTALTLAQEGGLIPVALFAMTGLAALRSRRESHQQILELVLFVLQHPQVDQETKGLALALKNVLESKLSSQAVEDARILAGNKDLNEMICELLVIS